MLYLLYGEDTYRSRKKVRDITNHFYSVAGSGESALHIVLPERSLSEVEAIAATGSLFRDKRLVVLEDPGGASPEVLSYLELKLPLLASSADIYVFWDRMPAKNIKETFLAAVAACAAKVMEYKQLTVAGASRFLDEEAKTRDISLSAAERRELLQEFSGDSWALLQALEKHALCADGKSENIKSPKGDNKQGRLIFAFLDAYGLRRRAYAWRLYRELLDQGETPDQLFWKLFFHTRTVLHVQSLLRTGTSIADVHRAAQVHPFVAKKASLEAGRISGENQLAAYRALVDLDFKTKQGRGDLTTGLERLLLSL